MEEIKLAYLYVKQTIAGGYLGGVLVCDTKGFPLEFRYTEPILPTKIQKVLYGHNLDKYLKVDVLLDSLLKVLGTKYDVLIVNDSKLLESDTPIIQMEIGQNPILSGNESFQKLEDGSYLLRTAQTTDPIRINFSKHSDIEKTLQNLVKIGEKLDVFEPLLRVQKSIELVCKKEI